jgi:hypothetical protein
MANELVTVYLNGHFAGSAAALQILEALQQDSVLGSWASRLHREIEEDRRVLRNLRTRIGQPHALKQALGWLAAMLSRVKLHQQMSGPLGRLKALETLAIGIEGKLRLWKALRVAVDSRLAGVDYDRLCARARAQFDEVEQRRLQIAHAVFSTSIA